MPAAAGMASWELTVGPEDASGNGFHAENHGVAFGGSAPDGTPAAYFDGLAAFLEVPAGRAPAFGSADFSLSVWIFTEKMLEDRLGDILGQFDPETRTGLNFGILSGGGVSNSQPNERTLHFGINQGHAPDTWTDCGRPGNTILVFGFAVYEGHLYAATCEPGEGESGRVYRYDGGTAWKDCGNPDGSNAVAALAVHEGRLYAGTSRYDTTGSALPASPNTAPGGSVYRYEGPGQWEYCGRLSNPETGTAATVGGLAVFRGQLYATTLKQEGLGLYRYEGETEWTWCGHPGRRVLNPTVFNGSLYMVSYDRPGGPFRFDGQTWEYVGATIDPPIDQDYSFSVYGGLLHLSTWPRALVYRMERDGVWTARGAPADELETMGMMVYNGTLYAGALPSARVYRHASPDRWIPVGQPLDTSEVKYRRAWSMAVYQGKLFCGVLPSGRVFSLEAGRNVTYDRALAPGWRHLAAVRSSGCLRLFIDGALVAESPPFSREMFDLTNDAPLRIGFGTGDYFHGWMRGLHVHGRALANTEIEAMFQRERPDALPKHADAS